MISKCRCRIRRGMTFVCGRAAIEANMGGENAKAALTW